MDMLIYKVTRSLDNKVVYIGQTTRTLQERVKEHRRNKCGKMTTILYQAFSKYGFDSFSFDVIEDGIQSINILNEKEKQYIREFRTYPPGSGAYNMTSGGNNRCEFSEEYIDKLRRSQKQRYSDPREVEKTRKSSLKMHADNPQIREANKVLQTERYKNSEERSKTSETTRRAFLLDPTIAERIGRATKQRYIDHPELREKTRLESAERFKKGPISRRRKVRCIETNVIYSSLKEAADVYNVKYPSIIKSIKQQTTCKGVHWKYE